MKAISVVIGTRNQRPTLERALESYSHQTLSMDAFEVILADSASEDTTDSLCRGGGWPFRLHHLALPHGNKSVARNAAIGVASGRLVLLSDADVVADRDLLAWHLRAHEGLPDRVVVGRQLMVDSVDEAGRHGRDALPRRHRAGERLSWGEFVTGNASMPRALLAAAGGFDERFSGYGYEDYELGYRLAALGLPIVYEPAAINWHCHLVRFEDDLARKREAGAAAVLFTRIHPSAALRLHLGVHSFNRVLWRGLAAAGWLQRASAKRAGSGGRLAGLARSFLLENAFQDGVREALQS